MGDFESKFNQILSSPESMEQILKLARSLSGSDNPQNGGEQSQRQEPQSNAEPQGTDGGIDPRLLGIFGAALKEYGSPSDKTALLTAIRPYLKSDRRDKIDRALQLAKLARVAKTMMPEFGGPKNV